MLCTVKMPKVSQGLSDKDLLAAKPQERDYKLYDREGLCLLVRKSGTKVWQYHYTHSEKRKTFTIGQYLQKGIAMTTPRGKIVQSNFELKF